MTLVVLLAGCTLSPAADPGFEELSETVSALPGVQDVSVDGAFDGLPTSRSLTISASVDEVAAGDLADLLDRTLAAAWSFDVYEPSAVSVSFADGAHPVPSGQYPPVLDMTDAVAELGLDDVSVGKTFLSVPQEQMIEHYGEWPAS
ncbi:hypothetical protein [Microbacterium sp. P05]|uniref:hypothetical protein n=1 Tax=Microbacterium sp. P05 TaxID=3366948 RepID=UPI0037474A2D